MNYSFKLIYFLLFLSISKISFSQKEIGSSNLLHQIKGLKSTGTALYLAAHPDDENTGLITWLAQEKQWRTAYLALTRGDGGQNLIGIEKGNDLGVLRSQELLAARSIDGGEQYFTRAVDFGYSKNPNETFDIWEKQEILKDVVWVIRKVRPDIIITRFPPDYRAGHGHHTASAMLAIEAYKAAADPKFKFNDERDGVLEAWQVHRVVWNTSWWAYRRSGETFPPKGVLSEEIGNYNPLIGKSYNSIASLARSQHKSQGFGTLIDRGSKIEYFEHLIGDSAETSIFEDIDDSWHRFGDYKLAKKIEQLIDRTINDFDAENPNQSISQLIEIKRLAKQFKTSAWRQYKLDKIDHLIASCAGLWYEATVDRYFACPNDSFELRVTLANRSSEIIETNLITLDDLAYTLDNKTLKRNVLTEVLNKKIWIPSDPIAYSQPYWLNGEAKLGIYAVKNPLDIGAAEIRPFDRVNILVEIQGESLQLSTPIRYKWRDRAKGELHRPFEVRPKISLNFESQVAVFSKGQQKKLRINLISNTKETKGTLELIVPEGWSISPKVVNFNTQFTGEQIPYDFIITPSENAKSGYISAEAKAEGKIFNQGMVTIEYDHIPAQVVFPDAKAKLIYADLTASDTKIAYIQGAGDEVAQSLREIGYDVTELNPDHINESLLEKYKVVIVGVRAYNTIENIANLHKELLKYVEKGGKVISQYNTSGGLKQDEVGPYNLTVSRDRITDENAKIKFLVPNHPILNKPNKITTADFDNWVQERGLYFPNKWDKKYTPILAANDPGEDELQGMLLTCNYGKGKFVYTSISFFRELPAGVPGAYRLFVNLIEF